MEQDYGFSGLLSSVGLQPTDTKPDPAFLKQFCGCHNPSRCQVDSIVAHFWTLIEPLEPGKSVKCETTVPLAGVSETMIRGMGKSKIVLR